jgi:GT2 family glycosyltransferase
MISPDFTIVVPTYRRPAALRSCLAALAQLDPAGPRFEVLVADDGGADGATADEAALAAARARLLRLSHAGPGAARNAGARAARGHWLAFTDDDCEPRPDWLTGFANGFALRPEAALGGRTINRLIDSTLADAHQILVDFVSHATLARDRHSQFFPSNNLAMPREAFLRLGGFDERFPFAAGEDRDLCARWLDASGTLCEAPEAVIDHGHALDLAGYCRMHARYGCGARRYRRLRAAREGGVVHLEPLRFYARLVAAPLARPRSPRAARLCLALLLSQLCHAGGYLREWASESPADRGGTSA